jgi:hypothetical protein
LIIPKELQELLLEEAKTKVYQRGDFIMRVRREKKPKRDFTKIF